MNDMMRMVNKIKDRVIPVVSDDLTGRAWKRFIKCKNLLCPLLKDSKPSVNVWCTNDKNDNNQDHSCACGALCRPTNHSGCAHPPLYCQPKPHPNISLSGSNKLSGPFSTHRKYKKLRVQILSDWVWGWGPEVGCRQNPCCGWWWFGASSCPTFALRCTEGPVDAGLEGKKGRSFSQNLLLS